MTGRRGLEYKKLKKHFVFQVYDFSCILLLFNGPRRICSAWFESSYAPKPLTAWDPRVISPGSGPLDKNSDCPGVGGGHFSRLVYVDHWADNQEPEQRRQTKASKGGGVLPLSSRETSNICILWSIDRLHIPGELCNCVGTFLKKRHKLAEKRVENGCFPMYFFCKWRLQYLSPLRCCTMQSVMYEQPSFNVIIYLYLIIY